MTIDSSRDKLAIRCETKKKKKKYTGVVCAKRPSNDKVRWNSIAISQWNSTLGVFWGLELCTLWFRSSLALKPSCL